MVPQGSAIHRVSSRCLAPTVLLVGSLAFLSLLNSLYGRPHATTFKYLLAISQFPVLPIVGIE